MKTSTPLIIGLLAGTLAVIGCSDDPPPPDGTGGTGGTVGSGGTGGTPAEGCADADVECSECMEDTTEWERCLGAVVVCNDFFEPSECQACTDFFEPARDCDGAGGTGGAGGTAGAGGTGGGGGTGGTPAEDCADAGIECSECMEETAELKQCLGGVFICNDWVFPSDCEACLDSLQPGSVCEGTGGTGGTGGTAGTGGTSGALDGCDELLCKFDQELRDRCEEFVPVCLAACEGTANTCGADECIGFALVFICNEPGPSGQF